MSSVGGQVTMPGFGVYCATKFALEGLTETLVDEVPDARFVIVEPGAFRTNLFDGAAAIVSAVMPEYVEAVGPTRDDVVAVGVDERNYLLCGRSSSAPKDAARLRISFGDAARGSPAPAP